MRARAAVVVASALACVSCAGSERPASVDPEVRGPPRVRLEVVDRHAGQLDGEIGPRPAGSQQELAAATYVLGHLQQAGYVARLDAVPVADLVRSTNVIAIPPGGAGATVVVAVAYDTAPGGPAAGGRQVGLFLELARALRRIDEEHSVEFVALGAERSRGGHLGSLALVRLLDDSSSVPAIVTLGPGSRGLVAEGVHAPEIYAVAGARAPASDAASDVVDGPFAAAGFDHTVVSGDARRVAAALLEFLRTYPR